MFGSLAAQPADSSPAGKAVLASMEKSGRHSYGAVRSVAVNPTTRAYVAWNSDEVMLVIKSTDGSSAFGGSDLATASNPQTPLWLQTAAPNGDDQVLALVPSGVNTARVVNKDGSTRAARIANNVLSADLPAGSYITLDASGGAVALRPTR